jgi:hypothetical protein
MKPSRTTAFKTRVMGHVRESAVIVCGSGSTDETPMPL